MVTVAIVIIILLFVTICSILTIVAFINSQQGAYISKGARSYEFNLSNNELRRINRLYLRRAFFESATDRNWRSFNEILKEFDDVKATNMLVRALSEVKNMGKASSKASISLERNDNLIALDFVWTKTVSDRCFLTITWAPIEGNKTQLLSGRTNLREVHKLVDLHTKVYLVFSLRPFVKRVAFYYTLAPYLTKGSTFYFHDGLFILGFSAEHVKGALCQAKRIKRRIQRAINAAQIFGQVNGSVIYTPSGFSHASDIGFVTYLHYLCVLAQKENLFLPEKNDALASNTDFLPMSGAMAHISQELKSGLMSSELVPVAYLNANYEFGHITKLGSQNIDVLGPNMLSYELKCRLIDANAKSLLSKDQAKPLFVDVTLDFLKHYGLAATVTGNVIWVANLTPSTSPKEVNAVFSTVHEVGGLTGVRVHLNAYLGKPDEQMPILPLLAAANPAYYIIDASFFSGDLGWTNGKIYQLFLAINNLAAANGAHIIYETKPDAARNMPSFMGNDLFLLHDMRATRT